MRRRALNNNNDVKLPYDKKKLLGIEQIKLFLNLQNFVQENKSYKKHEKLSRRVKM